jgi:hypothetical protein
MRVAAHAVLDLGPMHAVIRKAQSRVVAVAISAPKVVKNRI